MKIFKNRSAVLLVLIALIAVGLGCSGLSASTEAGEKAVAQFHQQFNEGKFDDIYSGAAKEFKNEAPQSGFVEMLRHVNGRLGKMNSKKQTSWNVSTTGAGTIVELKYDTEFENGTGKEEFSFIIVNDEAKLLSYSVESEKLKG